VVAKPKIAGLTRVQVQALGTLVKQPELFIALESIFVDMESREREVYEKAKESLVGSPDARSFAVAARARVLLAQDILDLFNRQKV
jgi:hypothetical protein